MFVTVCAQARKPILANPASHALLVRAWNEAAHWRVGRYLVMPDHVHFFCVPAHEATPLPRWIQYWKSLVARSWPRPGEQPIWQTGFWDRQVRTIEAYSQKWDYVRLNPVRRGLVTDASDWRYAGQLDDPSW